MMDTRYLIGAGAAGLVGLALWWMRSGEPDATAELPAPTSNPGATPVALGLPPLPYAASALSPAVSEKTVQIHHGVHQKGYVNGVNETLEQLHRVRTKKYPTDARRPMRRSLSETLAYNLGGAYLHDLYWKSLAPKGRGGVASPELLAQVQKDFGSMGMMVQELNDVGLAMQGSGWSLLAWSPYLGRLVVLSVGNHDNRIPPGIVPLLPIDVWEHAYYLDRGPKRAEYLKRMWGIINWSEVSRRYAAITRNRARKVAAQGPSIDLEPKAQPQAANAPEEAA
jgi:Fe-Mn family superoxide dismutase